MRFMSHSHKSAGSAADSDTGRAHGALHYESVLWIDSTVAPGARFAIHRVSFGRRMELSRKIRELSRKAEFLAAGTELHEKIEANILAQEIDALYLRWGLVRVEGLIIDGELTTTERLLDEGPEGFVREIVTAIRAQCGLSEAETKN